MKTSWILKYSNIHHIPLAPGERFTNVIITVSPGTVLYVGNMSSVQCYCMLVLKEFLSILMNYSITWNPFPPDYQLRPSVAFLRKGVVKDISKCLCPSWVCGLGVYRFGFVCFSWECSHQSSPVWVFKSKTYYWHLPSLANVVFW